MTSSDEEIRRAAFAVAVVVQLGVHAASDPLYQVFPRSLRPFFAPMLVAVQYALRQLAQITKVFLSKCSAARPNMIMTKTPLVLHRFFRLMSVSCGLFARGASLQAIAIYKDNPTQHTPVIHLWLVVGLRELSCQTRHLRIGQLEKIRHNTAPFSSGE